MFPSKHLLICKTVLQYYLFFLIQPENHHGHKLNQFPRKQMQEYIRTQQEQLQRYQTEIEELKRKQQELEWSQQKQWQI